MVTSDSNIILLQEMSTKEGTKAKKRHLKAIRNLQQERKMKKIDRFIEITDRGGGFQYGHT